MFGWRLQPDASGDIKYMNLATGSIIVRDTIPINTYITGGRNYRIMEVII